jgi:hypothetical protein
MNTGAANRDNVFGGDAKFGFGRLQLGGGYHQSNLTANDTPVNSHDNQAWDVNASFGLSDRFKLWGGYREVDNNYYAPGDWGRLGPIVNAGNIQGWQAGAALDVTHALRLTATGEWDKGRSDEPGNIGTFNGSLFDTDTNINKYAVRLDLRVNPNFSIYGAWEDTKFDSLAGGNGDAQFDWTTIGIGYGLSANAKFSLAYQFSNVSADGGGALGVGTRATGGILTSQLTIKF